MDHSRQNVLEQPAMHDSALVTYLIGDVWPVDSQVQFESDTDLARASFQPDDICGIGDNQAYVPQTEPEPTNVDAALLPSGELSYPSCPNDASKVSCTWQSLFRENFTLP
jgi:hypothetical protein